LKTTTPHASYRPGLGGALVLLGALAFATKPVFIKLAYADGARIDAVTLLTLRMGMALPFFLAAALWRGQSRGDSRRRGDWLALALLGLTGYYLSSLLDFMGLELIPASLERLILFLYPTFVVALTAAIHRRAIQRPQRIALALSYAGIVLVYGARTAPPTAHDTLGALLVLGSALTYALYLVASGHYIPRFGAWRFTAYSMAIACGAMISHFLLTRPVEQLAVPNAVLWLALALALVSTVLPAFLINAGIGLIGADRAALIGAALVLGGVVLVMTSRRKTTP